MSDFITVKYARLGSSPQEVALAPGTTVEAFRASQELGNVAIKRNGEALSGDTILADGWTLVLVNKVEGGL